MIPTLSFEEYLRFEALADVRHEYVGGHVYAMSGAVLRQGLLAQAINVRLDAGFLPRGCRVHTHDSKIRTPEGSVYYPDIYVTCRPIDDRRYDTDAEWVVEIRSPSTATTDDREKSLAYRRLPSIQGYLLADPDLRYLELRTAVDIGWHTVRVGDGGYVDIGPARLDVTEIFDELDRLAPRGGTETDATSPRGIHRVMTLLSFTGASDGTMQALAIIVTLWR